MEKLIEDSLVILGLTHKEIKFFLSLFKLGPATIQEVVKASRLERSTAYLIVDSLLEKGFITEDFKQYKKKLVACDPKVLLRMIASKERVVRRQEMELEEKLSELQSFYQASEIRPRVRVFEGQQALLSIWEDVLATKQEILLWTNQQTESTFFTKEFHEKFIQQRIRRKIPIRALAVNNDPGRALQREDVSSLRQSKLLPIQTSFGSETYIYDQKIAILDYKKDIIGIIIESEPIATTQRAIFEMSWNLVQ